MILAQITEIHVFLALVIIFLLFGGKKLPELARGLGEAMKEFKKAQRDMNDEVTQAKPTPPPPTPVSPSAATPVTPAATPAPHDPQKPA